PRRSPMFPWKLLFRFFSAMVLFATGGFAAGHDLPLPFTSPPEVAAPAAPVPDPTTTTTVPPAVDDSTTTTTTAPPVVVDPVPAPVDTPPLTPAPTTPPAPVTTTTTAPKPPAVIPAPVTAPPAVPTDGDAPSVCAAAATTVCGPAAPVPAADDTHAARVQRCQDWWNSLADAFAANNRPEWSARARDIAGRCEELITGWEQAQQRWQDHQNQGDHNNDGHPDNGWNHGQDGHNDGNNQTPPPAQPRAKQVSRHGEGRH
ncbi:MAG TPA: hypothetical protein VGP90_07220, partial [Acidimicrobiia bacterium]|nr:hypothetical protein [Acidimicrobiia bacterium]